MRKILLTVLSVLMLVCIGAMVACKGAEDDSVNYYTLVFRQTNGVAYDCEVPSGYEVKEGSTVTFKLVIDDEAIGTPVVLANNEPMEANEDGSYSIVMTENVVIRVDGITAQGEEYNKFIFDNTPGVVYISRVEGLENGMMVRMGMTVSFTISINERYQGTPIVYANNTVLSPDVNNVYSFDMIAPTTIRVEGIVKHVNVTYEEKDTRVKYYTGDKANKSYIESDTVKDMLAGQVLEFKVQISVYNKPDSFEVLANSTVLRPEADGYYRYELSDDTIIKVKGLEMDVSFLERNNGGAGTWDHPFIIERPIDLYQMAMQINSGWYSDGRFLSAYYSLEKDIDLEGEQLFIIGDGSSGYSVFAGTFYGNGHTISNYVMSDRWIEQENFTDTYITNVGLFGYVTPTADSYPAIYDLKLNNFKITADASRYPVTDENPDPTLSLGALVGVAYGADITGCSATNGEIQVTSGDYGGYVGGLIGQQISAYSAEMGIQVYAPVVSCYTDVDISISVGSTEYGFVYAAGGIVGMLAVGEEHLSAFVLNSYATGSVAGALNAGGVVGYAVAGTSVVNCYSSGSVTAYSHFTYDSNWEGDNAQLKEFYHANAGGVVGRAGFNTVIYNSFSMGEVYASSAVSSKDFAIMKADVAYLENGDDLQDAHCYVSSVVGCPKERVTTVTESFLRNTMRWDAEDWKLVNGMPAINYDSTGKKFTISFEAVGDGDFGDIASIEIDSQYYTMSMWYAEEKISEYPEGKNGLKSYAYFFDAECTQRVFFGFIPTTGIKLYVGYADYTEVAGTYYLGESAMTGARVEIETDGTFVYHNGGLIHSSTYTWDGENLVFLYSYFGDLAKLDAEFRDYYLSNLYVFGATLSDAGKLTITGGRVQEVEYQLGVTGYLDDGTPVMGDVLANTGNTFDMFTVESPLVGVRAIENFVYGSYYGDGVVHKFNGNGTGVRTQGQAATTFTYTVNQGVVTINYGESSTVQGTVGKGGYVTMIGSSAVKPYDGFTGTWEREFAVNAAYTFSGEGADGGTGTWSYNCTGNKQSGTYTIEDGGVLKDTSGAFTAVINEDGFLEITEKNSLKPIIYYMDGSFAGEWYYSQRLGSLEGTVTVGLTLNGISNQGYGTAKANYGTGETYDLTYHAVAENDTYKVYVYKNEYLYASMTYVNSADGIMLAGTVDGVAGGRMTPYDMYRGLWISNNEQLPTIQFNGQGFNDLSAVTDQNGAGPIAIRGTVFVSGNSAGKYDVDYSTMKATYTYKNVKYTLEYNEQRDEISATPDNGGSSFTFVHRDMWYDRQLEDSNGFVYTFTDGRGNLESGGTVTADDGNINNQRKYTYYLESDGSITLVSSESTRYEGGKIAIANDDSGKSVFMFTQTSGKKVPLTRHTAFTGDWIIGGETGTLKIDKIYADETATGYYKFNNQEKQDVVFKYNFEENYLTFNYTYTDDKEETHTETYYVNALVSKNATELSIGPDKDITGGNNSICISTAKADDYYNKTYYVYDTKTNKDTGETIVFDGLSKSVFGNGMAVRYNSNGSISRAYVYSSNSKFAFIVYNGWRYCVKPVSLDNKEDVEIMKSALFCLRYEDKYFALVRPDALFEKTIKDADNSSITYTFDGVGGVTKRTADGSEEELSYTIFLTDNLLFKHVLELTAADGTNYTATLDQSGASAAWTLKVREPDAYFGLVVTDKAADTAQFLFDGAGRVVRLSSVDATVNYEYEVISVDGKKTTFKFTMIESEYSYVYTAVLDQTNSDSSKWTITLTLAK